MNYKKIMSIFLVVASLFVTVGANSGLTCFANENHIKMVQREHDSKVNEKTDSENKAQMDSHLRSITKALTIWSVDAMAFLIIMAVPFSFLETICDKYNSTFSKIISTFGAFSFSLIIRAYNKYTSNKIL